jgi:hypothetical protein
MVKRSTWMLLGILALVTGAYLLLKYHPLNKTEPTPTVTPNEFLITSSEGVLQSLRIFDNNGHVMQIQRDLSKTWVVTIPNAETADQGLAGAAETQVGALRIITVLESPPDLGTIGLNSPAYTIELGFANGKNRKIEVGEMTPNGSGYYIRYDSEKIYVISPSGIDSIVKLLSAPPYPATETPSPTTESTSTPTL